MKQEDIEKAAGEYSGSILGFKDNPHVMRTHKAFAEGAQWRINSVWHDKEEEAINFGKWLIILDGKDSVCVARRYPIDDWEEMIETYHIERWAYVSDLLPERKEGTK